MNTERWSTPRCSVSPMSRDGERLKAVVELREPIGTEALADHVRSRLADYKVPREWEIVDELPRDLNGKVLKRLLRAASSRPR